MRIVGLFGLSLLLVACGHSRSSIESTEFPPLLVQEGKGQLTDGSSENPVFRSVPAEPITSLEILPLPSPQRPSIHARSTHASMGEGDQQNADPIRRVLPLVQFPYDSWMLTPKAKKTLRNAGEWLREFIPGPLSITGHADSRGTQAYNQALGLKRARTVATYLQSLGIQETLMYPLTVGELEPSCTDQSETCYAANRRAVVVVERRDGRTLLSGLYRFPPATGDVESKGRDKEDKER